MPARFHNLQIEIVQDQVLEEIPSASGIAGWRDCYYVIGDDSPFLFFLDSDFKVISRTIIHPVTDLKGATFPKSLKPDFEAMEIMGDKEILIFGSGSLSPYRNQFLRIPINKMSAMESYDLSDMYDRLRNAEIMGNAELNIEALASYGAHLYLFNRGKNIIFGFLYSDLLKYLKGHLPFPEPIAIRFHLPKIEGIEAGFSGATVIRESPCIVFTASVENTQNAYDDGEVYGSFVGIIPISGTGIINSYTAVPIPYMDRPLKVESVTVGKELSRQEADLVLVTDSDGGNSRVLKCKLSWK
ncbi:MAG TPA: hypothetical protein VLZ54_03465 [Arenibacter sp.]|nr:hypothetical protein [Arenibacter sp.]